MWKKGSWILHHGNVPAQNTLSVKMFLVKYKIPVLEHPPNSPHLALYDFFLFPKINPFRAHRCCEGKGDGGNEEAIRKGPAALLQTVESFHGAV
jgi:hypothetical protein